MFFICVFCLSLSNVLTVPIKTSRGAREALPRCDSHGWLVVSTRMCLSTMIILLEYVELTHMTLPTRWTLLRHCQLYRFFVLILARNPLTILVFGMSTGWFPGPPCYSGAALDLNGLFCGYTERRSQHGKWNVHIIVGWHLRIYIYICFFFNLPHTCKYM